MSNQFWTQFWPGFAANVAAGLVVICIAYLIIRFYRKAAVRVEAQSIKEDSEEIVTRISIRNVGRHIFGPNEVYWHIFVDDKLDIVQVHQEPELDKQLIGGNITKHFRGTIEGSLFPNRPWELLRIVTKKSHNCSGSLFYFVSTSEGVFPKYLRWIRGGENRQAAFPQMAEISTNGLTTIKEKGPTLTQFFKYLIHPK
jgi:hypothetical protein